MRDSSFMLTTTTTTIASTAPGQCKDHSVSPLAQQWAQQQSSNLFFYQTVASSVPTIVMTYVLGLYTHQLGRKFVLILSMFGNVFQYGIWLLIIYFEVISTVTDDTSHSLALLVAGLLVAHRSLRVKFSGRWQCLQLYSQPDHYG